MIGQERYKEINAGLSKALEEKQVLIAVHRGTAAGNLIENTTAAFKTCLAMGADMFEIDLSLTCDGVLYGFHDGNEKRLLGKEKSIFDMSSQEVDETECINGYWQPSGRRLERFETVLQSFTHGELFNIDRAWNYLDRVHEVLQKYPNAVKQAVIKTPAEDRYLQFFENCPVKYMYMPIARSIADVEKVLEYKNINLVGVEAIISSKDDPLFQNETISRIKGMGLYFWANVITLGSKPGHRLYASYEYEDDMAIENGPEDAWGKLIDKGINVLQTDWPWQLSAYRKEKLGL